MASIFMVRLPNVVELCEMSQIMQFERVPVPTYRCNSHVKCYRDTRCFGRRMKGIAFIFPFPQVSKPQTSQADPPTRAQKRRRRGRGGRGRFRRRRRWITESEDLDPGEGRHEARGIGRRGDEGQEGGLQESRRAG